MEEKRAEIIELLKSKVSIKQDIADYSESVLADFKRVANEEIKALQASITDERIRLKIVDKSSHEFTLYIGSDALVFQLHRNIFRLPDEYPMWETDYLKADESNGYFAMINIYNFLAESFEQNRLNDAGYLIGRFFVNRNEHFMVEGKGQLGFLFTDLQKNEVNDKSLRHIIQCAMSFSIDFDLITPPYEMVQEVTLQELLAISSELQQATGKRLGFKFASEYPASK